jgi:class 3 adenylate cyclase
VLFADISGFTPLTESLNTLGAEGVERLTTHLNEYFSQMIKLITDHGGDIVKFAGDALMVVWPTKYAFSQFFVPLGWTIHLKGILRG